MGQPGRPLIHKDSYYQRHKEKIKAQIRKCQKRNPEKTKEYAKRALQKFREEHPEKYKQMKRQDYLKYREWYLTYHRKRRPADREGKRKMRMHILEKLGGSCSRCGYSEHQESLEIHHIDRNRKNNDDNNLILLCANCHRFITINNIKKPK